MPPLSSFASAVSLVALGARIVLAEEFPTCLSYGMDFQNGQSYFQNSLSSDNFTFVTQFDDCQNDIAYNLLVDPTGEQTLCSDTSLRPDSTNQLSTCPIQKSQLYSGSWSVVVISNNGDAGQVAYERDFELSVGPQLTVTYTPTVTATSVYQPIATETATSTQTVVTVLDPSTVTSPSVTVTPTITVTPPPALSTTTKALLTIKLTSYSVNIAYATKTKTASCDIPTRQADCDPSATIQVTVGPAATVLSRKFRREFAEEKRARFVAARAARLAARAPDPQPLTVTDMNTSDYPTVTTTNTAPTITATITTTAIATATSTPPPITVVTGEATAEVVTTTAAAKTIILTKWTIAKSVTTKVLEYVVTVTTTITPSGVPTACKKAGGILL